MNEINHSVKEIMDPKLQKVETKKNVKNKMSPKELYVLLLF